ncbi:U-scoloptoxin(01)-Er1a-like [Schistocerca americana]|uniref:U-scoloptoxin(01)-Er1a-like n=1 Tax=Schistocerca americana TaxID=7009 RepID=UPI001F4F2E4C|nr:U-scoloptoxin(01)-Er1a-like [Schistocerca americana]XP_047104120.1 U-scoloptoxin(01)-Er1a-like [Schistocerca piceifrons]XP_049954117.1 U-scoloptoxin(01)-Er1a-like [Schistocerca serialis cubense]
MNSVLLLALLLAPAVLGGVSILFPLPAPRDPYHELHLPRDPPLYPQLHSPPHTAFSCAGRSWGLYADVDAACQAFHLCRQDSLVSSFLCPNGTLFNQQFQVCDQFYNVRCGVPLEDL